MELSRLHQSLKVSRQISWNFCWGVECLLSACGHIWLTPYLVMILLGLNGINGIHFGDCRAFRDLPKNVVLK